MKAWIYLILAGLLEIGWLFSLKFFSIEKLKQADWLHFFTRADAVLTLIPATGYIFFGVTNVLLLNLAFKTIPASMGYAVWAGVTIIGSVFIDVFLLKVPINLKQISFIVLIMVGIAGLRWQTQTT